MSMSASLSRRICSPGLVRRIYSGSGDVRDMERHGIPSNYAKVISTNIMSIKEHQKSKLSKFESKLEKSAGQVSDFKHQVDKVTAEMGKLRLEFDVLKSEVKQEHSELKTAVETSKAGQRAALDIKSRLVREMIEQRKTETNVQFSGLSLEVETCKTNIEASKNDILKLFIGVTVSIAAAAVVLIHIPPPPSSSWLRHWWQRSIVLTSI